MRSSGLWASRSGILAAAAVALMALTSGLPGRAGRVPAEQGYRIVNSYPHDAEAYTQGLLYHDGFLFESTGRNGHSSVRKVRLETGEVLGWIDLTGLLSPVYRLEPEAVLNGIAYDAPGKRLFVTGKLWPKLFEIEVR